VGKHRGQSLETSHRGLSADFWWENWGQRRTVGFPQTFGGKIGDNIAPWAFSGKHRTVDFPQTFGRKIGDNVAPWIFGGILVGKLGTTSDRGFSADFW
jgi:hypothetical protein